MRLYKRNETYYTWYFTADGKRVIRSTKCHDYEAAKQVARKLERAGIDPEQSVKRHATVQDAVDVLVRTREEQVVTKTRSPETLEFYKEKTKNIIRVFGGTFKLVSLRAADVDRFVSIRVSEKASAHTVKKEIGCLRVALKLSKRAGLWSGDEGAMFPVLPAGYKPRTRVMTTMELNKLLGSLLPEQAAMVAFVCATGVRLSEMRRVQKTDIKNDYLSVRGTKTVKSTRIVPVVSPLHKSLLNYALEHTKGTGSLLFGHLWCSIQSDLKKACKEAGVDPVSPNDLRRTALTFYRELGAPLDLIAALAGHSSVLVTERVYTKLTPEALRNRLEVTLGVTGKTQPSEAHLKQLQGHKLSAQPAGVAELADAPKHNTDKVRVDLSVSVVPETGVEPVRVISSPDFESGFVWSKPRQTRRVRRRNQALEAHVKQNPSGHAENSTTGNTVSVSETTSRNAEVEHVQR